MTNKTHALKIEQRYFDRLKSGEKTCEIRYDDRDYQVGDLLRFLGVCGAYDFYLQITHITRWIGLKDGYVALSLKKVKLNRNGRIINHAK